MEHSGGFPKTGWILQTSKEHPALAHSSNVLKMGTAAFEALKTVEQNNPLLTKHHLLTFFACSWVSAATCIEIIYPNTMDMMVC